VRLRAEDELERAVRCDVEHPVVHGADDPLRVVPVVRAAVDREREVDGVALLPSHPVGAAGVNGCVLVEGVGVVAAPLLVRADNVDEARVARIGPHVGVERDLQDREDPLVALEDGLLVPGRIRALVELRLEPAQLVDELAEDGARLEIAGFHGPVLL
jgi:hypothetical protein